MERDEDLTRAFCLGFVQPLPQLLHLLFVDGPGRVPRRRRAVVVLACPEEDEAGAPEVHLVDETLLRDPELVQIRERGEEALDVGVIPDLVVSDGREDTPW